VGYAGIVLTTRQARRIAEGGATMHLSFKYMRAIAEGTQAVICSKYCYQGVCLLRLHAVVTFLGNRFIPNSGFESSSREHCLSMPEYQAMRMSWPTRSQQRDGSVGWLFDIVEPLDDLWLSWSSVRVAGSTESTVTTKKATARVVVMIRDGLLK